jgi:hypothetical protein
MYCILNAYDMCICTYECRAVFLIWEVLSRGRLSMVDLLVLTSLDQLLFKIENIIKLFYKTSCLNEEVNCTEPFP